MDSRIWDFTWATARDSIAIDFAPIGSTLVVNTGAGDDRLSVGYAHGLGSLYADLIGLVGGEGTDKLVFSNAGDYTDKDNIYITGGNIQNLTTEGGQIAIPDDSGFETMGIILGGGHNTIEVDDPTVPLTIRGTDGIVEVTVTSMQSGQTLDFYGGSAADHLYVGDTESAKIVSGAVKFYGGGGDDVAYVYEVDSQGTVLFDGGAGDDILHSYRFFTYTGGASGYTTQFIDGAVLFFGGEGTDGIVIKQTLVQAKANSITFDSTTAPGYDFEMGHIGGIEMAQGLWYDTEELNIQLQGRSDSANQIYIDATGEGLEKLTVLGGSYEDRFHVGELNGLSLSSIHGDLLLNGGGGYNDSLNIDNADDTTDWSGITLTSTGFTGMGLSDAIGFSGIAWVAVTLGSGVNEIWLESIPYIKFPEGYGRDHSYTSINNLNTDDTVFMSSQVADMTLQNYWKLDGDITPAGIKVDSPQTVTEPDLPTRTVTVINAGGLPVLSSQGKLTFSSASGSYYYYKWQATNSVDQNVLVYVQFGYGGGLKYAVFFHEDILNIPPVVTLFDQSIDEGGMPTFTITDPGINAGETYNCYWQITNNATGDMTVSDTFPWNSQLPFPTAAGNYDATLRNRLGRIRQAQAQRSQ